MGRVLLITRLALRDLRRRPIEAVLLFLVMSTATATLALGLILGNAASDPYNNTREATSGPDVVASTHPAGMPDGPVSEQSGPVGEFPDAAEQLADLEALREAPQVMDASGPFPVAGAAMETAGDTVNVQAVGRDTSQASVDQPDLVEGSWVRAGGVVLEAGLAAAFDVESGDSVTIAGQSFEVVGVAVTATTLPYPEPSCVVPCVIAVGDNSGGQLAQLPGMVSDPGVVWVTEADARGLVPPEHLMYTMNLKLEDPAQSELFVATYGDDTRLESWQHIRDNANILVRNTRQVLIPGSGLLGLLAIASVAVLVGGRMADQSRRVGLLKAVGGTPKLVGAVLLAEYVAVALLAAGAGLLLGWLAGPLLTEPTAGLLGSGARPEITTTVVGTVLAVALGVAAIATFIPALRAARTSTVAALDDTARAPKRVRWLIALSARLPTSLLMAIRVAARRPRRMVLGIASIAVSVSGLVAALGAYVQLGDLRQAANAELAAARNEQLSQVLFIVVAMLVTMAIITMIFISWATVLDARHASALTRALGATPQEVTVALSAAQVIPAAVGSVLGIPVGLLLLAAVSQDEAMTTPPLWQLLAVVPVTVLVIAALTSIPARSGARHPVTESLQAEHA